MKVLMVCLGNICRSPMMEGWLRDAVSRHPRLTGRVDVDSAAIGAWHVGRPPDPRAIQVAMAHGIDIASQRARQLVRDDFSRFDLLLFADADTLDDGRQRADQQHRHIAHRYLDWAGVEGARDLADPYYGDLDGFHAVWARIAEAGERIVKRLAKA